MKINEIFLEKHTRLYNIINVNKLYKKLTWVVNFENGQCISNKIFEDSKLSLVTFNNENVLHMYGSEKSNGIDDICKVSYKMCNGTDKKIEKIELLTMYFGILNVSSCYVSHWNPLITSEKKIYIEIYE